jgi:hypothetical protein
MIAQTTLHRYTDADATVKFVTGHSYTWQTGESMPTVEMTESRNDGQSYVCKAIIPLAEAVAFAKAILALAQEAEEDAWIERQYEYELDREFVVDCAVEHGSGYASGVYYPSIQ